MPNIFLYGGCVIRDAYEKINTQAGLAGYVARQSLISAMNPPSKELTPVQLESPFQSRMVNGDIQSNLIPALRKLVSRVDLVVMDCQIERLGVHRLEDGSFITKSSELNKSGALKTLRKLRPEIKIGTDRHTNFYTHAARRLTSRLEALGLKERTIIINAPWALSDTEGHAFNSYKGISIEEMSDNITRLTGILSREGLTVVDIPQESIEAPVYHKWGRAPYHFGDRTMNWIASSLIDRLG